MKYQTLSAFTLATAMFTSLLAPSMSVQAATTSIDPQVFGNLAVKAPMHAQQVQEIQIEDTMISMSDGTMLATRIYRPKAAGTYPVLFARTPYNSGAFNLPTGQGDYADIGQEFAPLGYVVVVQDVRGKFASQGTFDQPLRMDKQDGEEALKWIAAQAWSNQQVGMFGASARGMTQNILIDSDSPYLKAMFVITAPSKYYEEVLFQGGAFRQELVQVWLAGQNIYDMGRIYGADSDEMKQALFTYLNIGGPKGYYWHMPLAHFPTMGNIEPYKKTRVPAYYEAFNHSVKDGFYDYMDVSFKWKNSDIPTYQVGGWYDIFREGTLRNFSGLQTQGSTGAKGKQKLLMGPWSHLNIGDSPAFTGDEVNITGEMKRWFDYWLKGEENGIMSERPVKYFTMGSNQWKESDTWPLKTSKQKFYFRSYTGTRDDLFSLYDGMLNKQRPKTSEQSNSYVYDPSKPTLTIGGQLLFPDINIQKQLGLVGPQDQREADKESLTYTTDPLNEDSTITGEVTALLYASSDRKDTDFVVRLTDVAPDGTSTLITDGVIRARYHKGQDQEVFLKKDRKYRFSVSLGNTSHTFKKGHAIRVAVNSSNFPRFDRNANTGNPIGSDTLEDLLIANNTIYHDKRYASYISLPVVGK